MAAKNEQQLVNYLWYLLPLPFEYKRREAIQKVSKYEEKYRYKPNEHLWNKIQYMRYVVQMTYIVERLKMGGGDWK